MRITIESAMQESKRWSDYAEVLKNHCSINESDSDIEKIFKLYASLQKVEDVRKVVCKEYNMNFKNSSEITTILKKEHIEDALLENMVKYLVFNADKHRRRKN